MNNNSRTFNSARNITMGLISKLITVILTFVGRRIFIQILSIEYMGIAGLFGGILTVLSLADLGIETAMIYSYYKPLAEGDDLKLAALTHFYRRAYNIIAVVVAVIGLCILPFLRFIVNTAENIPYLEVYYLITLGNSVFSYLFVYKASVIRADQRDYLLKRLSIWISVIRLVLQIVVLYATRSFLVYCSVSILATLLNNLLISYVAGREYPQIKQKAELGREEKRSIFRQLKSVFIYRVSAVAIDSTDSIIISTLVGTAFVGLYNNYITVVSNVGFIVGILFASLTPSIGNLLVKELPERKYSVFKVTQTASYWVAFVFTFCLYFLMDEFVSLWLGSQFMFNEATKIAILLVFYLDVTQRPVKAFREASGLYERTKYIMLAAAAVNLVASILLGIRFGIAGIIFATFISKVCTHVWYESILLYKDFFQEKVRGYFVNQLINFVLIAMCIIAFRALPLVIDATNWLLLIAKGFMCFVIINIICFLRFSRTAEFADIKQRAKHAIFSRIRKN